MPPGLWSLVIWKGRECRSLFSTFLLMLPPFQLIRRRSSFYPSKDVVFFTLAEDDTFFLFHFTAFFFFSFTLVSLLETPIVLV